MRHILLIVCFILSGCSAVFSNQASPVHLNTCEYWPATVDLAILVTAGVALNIIDQTDVMDDPTDEMIILGVGTMYTLAFLMSAMTGYAEYAQCQGYIPLFQENIRTLKDPYNWIGDR